MNGLGVQLWSSRILEGVSLRYLGSGFSRGGVRTGCPSFAFVWSASAIFQTCRGTPSFSLFLAHEFSAVRISVIIFTILVAVVLLNLLVAQLNMAYQLAHSDMEGYARLTRASIIVTTVEQVSRKRWRKFLQRLNRTNSWKSCHQWLFNTAWQMGNAEFNSPVFEKTRHAGTWENAKESEFWAALGV